MLKAAGIDPARAAGLLLRGAARRAERAREVREPAQWRASSVCRRCVRRRNVAIMQVAETEGSGGGARSASRSGAGAKVI
jgi:hypothetical protein